MYRALDLTIATVVLAFSIWGTHYFYKSVKVEEHSQSQLTNFELPSGTTNLNILSENRCVGSVNVEITKDHSLVLKTKSQMRIASGSKQEEVNSNLHAEFNPLGQLVLSQTNIKIGDISLSATTKYAKPIQVALSAKGPGLDRTVTTEIAGPIVLEEMKNGNFRLIAPGMGTETLSVLKSPLAHFTKDLGLSLVQSTLEETNCTAKPGALQLRGAIQKSADLIPFSKGLFTLGGGK